MILIDAPVSQLFGGLLGSSERWVACISRRGGNFSYLQGEGFTHLVQSYVEWVIFCKALSIPLSSPSHSAEGCRPILSSVSDSGLSPGGSPQSSSKGHQNLGSIRPGIP